MADALALVTIVVHARLRVRFGEDGGSLAERDEVAVLQLIELPAHERVVVRVVVGRQKGAPPVHPHAKLEQVRLAQGRKHFEPMHRVDKGDGLLWREAHRAEDIPLRHHPPCLGLHLGRGLLGRSAAAAAAALLVVFARVLLRREQRERVLAVCGLFKLATRHTREAVHDRDDLEAVLRADREPFDRVAELRARLRARRIHLRLLDVLAAHAFAHEDGEAGERLSAGRCGRLPADGDRAIVRVALDHLGRRRREVGQRLAVRIVLLLQLERGRLDGHACAVEREWEERLLAEHALVRGGELGLGERERVTQVQLAVHVRIREGDHELAAVPRAGGRVDFKGLAGLPLGLNPGLHLEQLVASRRPLGRLCGCWSRHLFATLSVCCLTRDACDDGADGRGLRARPRGPRTRIRCEDL